MGTPVGLVAIEYRITGKFGGKNFWQIYSFQAFGKKIGSVKGLLNCNFYFGWVLVRQITDNSPNSPNFLPAKLSHYMIYCRVAYLKI